MDFSPFKSFAQFASVSVFNLFLIYNTVIDSVRRPSQEGTTLSVRVASGTVSALKPLPNEKCRSSKQRLPFRLRCSSRGASDDAWGHTPAVLVASPQQHCHAQITQTQVPFKKLPLMHRHRVLLADSTENSYGTNANLLVKHGRYIFPWLPLPWLQITSGLQ